MTDKPAMHDYPMRRTCPFDPAPEYRELREADVLPEVRMPTGRNAWAVTRPEEIRTMLIDERFSSNLRHPGFPVFAEQQRPPEEFNTSLIGLDDPEHRRARRAVAGEFTARRSEEQRPRIRKIVDDCLDSFLEQSPPADIMTGVTLQLPLLVICDLLDVPDEDRSLFHRLGIEIMDTSDQQRGAAAFAQLNQYMDHLVTLKEADPGDDVIGRQIRRESDEYTPTHSDLVGLAFMLYMAGHEATGNTLAMGLAALLDQPEKWEYVVDHPDRIPGVVEEIVRYTTLNEIATFRVAVDDVDMRGVTIRAGDGVLGLISAANRDPREVSDPNTLDVERDLPRHLGFGSGRHMCLGQHLARVEMQEALLALSRRAPGLRLTMPADELSFRHEGLTFGLQSLPVLW